MSIVKLIIDPAVGKTGHYDSLSTLKKIEAMTLFILRKEPVYLVSDKKGERFVVPNNYRM